MERLETSLVPSKKIAGILLLAHVFVLVGFSTFLSFIDFLAFAAFVLASGVFVSWCWKYSSAVDLLVLQEGESAVVIRNSRHPVVTLKTLWLLSGIVVLKVKTQDKTFVIIICSDSKDENSFRLLKRYLITHGRTIDIDRKL